MREYVVAKVDALVEANFPSGSVTMWIVAGHSYLASEAFVRQNPTLFRPVERPTEATAA